MILFEKKKRAAERVEGVFCGEAPAEGRRGAARKHPARGSLERRAGFLPEKSSGPVPSFRAGNFCGSVLVPHPPILQKGKVASPPVVLFRCPVELGYCQLRSPSLFTFPRASGSCRDESSLSGKKPKQVSFYYLVLSHC